MNRRLCWILLITTIASFQAIETRGALPEGDDVAVSSELLSGLRYHYVGPSRGGRVTAVAGHPDTPGTFFMGGTGGGVFKTDDWGNTWVPVTDGQIATGSIGAIALGPDDPDLVWVATGSDGLRSNVIIGKGVYKSTDGGETWALMGLEDVGNTGAVLIDPRNSDRVFVAAIGNPFLPNAERGVYRTEDGGSTWELVLHISERTGVADLEFAPDDPDRIYAALWEGERKPWTILSGGREGGVHLSTDGGDSWGPANEGLPTGLRGKADLAVSAGDPDRVYVLIEAPESEGGVYRSDDRGASWRQITDFQPIRNRPFYYTNLHAHPVDPDTLWGMAEGHWKSTDGGETWQSERVPHGDNHDLWVDPNDPQVMIQSNDGGANITRDGGRTWSTQTNQPTAELYQVDVSDAFPYRLYAGQQDNSTISVPSRSMDGLAGDHTAQWQTHGGCETGPVVPKPGDPDIVYANCKGRFGVWNARTGQEQQYYVGFWNLYGRNPADLPYRFQRVSPIHVSPHDPNRVYHTSQYVHVTEDGGATWETISPDLTAFSPETQVVSGSPITLDVTGEEHFSVLYDIQESPHEAGVLWAGSNDGPIHVTRDAGATWTDVTPEGIGPYGRVQNIEVSPHQPGKAYATILRYQLGDFAPYVFRTDDYGTSWVRITNGIPDDQPVRVVREDPAREGLLFAGTEFGMFVSFDDGASWQSLQLNLPATPVTDIRRVGSDLVLSTMGRGFWILFDLTPLWEMDPGLTDAAAHLFAVDATYRLHGGGFRFRPAEPHEPDYPAPGANIDYWLGEAIGGPLTLEIRDASGALVRMFSSEAAGESVVVPEPGMRDWQLERVGTPRLPASRALHRFTWDLRYGGPWAANERSAGRGGPMVPPGTYTAELSTADWSRSVQFDVFMDPRVSAEGITPGDVEAQATFGLMVRDAVSSARLLEQRLTAAAESVARDELMAVLVTDERRYSPPMLLDQLQYLYSNLFRADQRPGQDAYDRFDELRGELAELERRFAALGTD